MTVTLLAQQGFGMLQLGLECFTLLALLPERVLELGNFAGIAGFCLRDPGIGLFVQAAGQPADEVLDCLAHGNLCAAGSALFLFDLL